jgi:hypothetical protein
MEESFEYQFLNQLYAGQNKLSNALDGMIANIFNLYDYNGDGMLDYDDYISFISDLMYISVLMNRITETEYNLDNVARFARWSSSNFPNNLFHQPRQEISYHMFLEGVMLAITEHRSMPILGKKMYFTSFMPEIINYFNYYEQVATRRGWPTYTSINQQLLENEYNEITQRVMAETAETTQEPELQLEREVEPQLEREVEPQLEREVEPQLEREVEPQLEREVEPQLEREVEPQLEREVELERDSQHPITQQQEEENTTLQDDFSIDTTEPSICEDTTTPVETISHNDQLQDYQNRRHQRYQQQRQREQYELRVQQMQEQEAGRQRLQQQILSHLQNTEREQEQQATTSIDQFEPFEIPEQEIVVNLQDAGEVALHRDELGFEPIEGDINIVDFVNENINDNIVFKVGERYYLANKSRINSMIQIGEKDNSIFYGCTCEIVGDWTLPQTWALLQHTVIINPKYYNIQQLGLPIRYVPLSDIETILQGNLNYFSIERSDDYTYMASFASDNVLNHGIGSMSGLHCQGGQEDIVYTIKKFTPKIIFDKTE